MTTTPDPNTGSTLTTAAFWQATAERAVRTFAQAALALITVGAIGVLDVDWVNVVSVAGLAALASVLTSIAGDMATGQGPAFTSAEHVTGQGQDQPGGR